MKKFTPELAVDAPPAPALLQVEDLTPEAPEAMAVLRMEMSVRELPEDTLRMPLIAVIEQEYYGVDDIPDEILRREAQDRRRVAMLCAEAATILLAQDAVSERASEPAA